MVGAQAVLERDGKAWCNDAIPGQRRLLRDLAANGESSLKMRHAELKGMSL